MTSFNLQDQVFEIVVNVFEKSFMQERALLEYHKKCPQIIGNFCLLLQKFATQSSLVLQSKIDKYRKVFTQAKALTPGFPGQQVLQLDQINHMINEQCGQAILLAEHIQNDFLPKFKCAIITSTTTMNKISYTIKEAENAWRDIRRQMESNDSTINSICKEVKSHKKDILKVHGQVATYMATVKSQKYLAKKLNIAYARFVKLFKESIQEMRQINMERCKVILEFSTKLARLYDEMSIVIAKVNESIFKRNSFDDIPKMPISDLITFIVSHDIRRTSIGNVSYEQYKFKQPEIDPIIGIPSYQTGSLYEPPILIAQALNNFVASAPNEISCYKGQTIYLYEPPIENWVLASSNKTFPEGYVPRNNIKVLNKKIALSLKQLAYENGKLGIFPGEFLIIEYEDEKGYACENTSGRFGYVDKNAVIVEKLY